MYLPLKIQVISWVCTVLRTFMFLVDLGIQRWAAKFCSEMWEWRRVAQLGERWGRGIRLWGAQLYKHIQAYGTLLIHQHWLSLIYGEVCSSSVSGEWVKSAPEVPMSESWKPNFQSVLGQPLAPLVVVQAEQTANKASELWVNFISSPRNAGNQLWSLPWLIWWCCQRRKKKKSHFSFIKIKSPLNNFTVLR